MFDRFKRLYEEKGLVRHLMVPGTLNNGDAERKNGTLLDMVRSMMTQANILIIFWGVTNLVIA